MRIWYDFEFLEDGRSIWPISIGMVRADGEQLYLVNEGIMEEDLRSRIIRFDWLMEHVVPHLPLAMTDRGEPDYVMPAGPRQGRFKLDLHSNTVVPRRFMRNAVREFVLGVPDPELWAWYGAYDHVALCQLFGRMTDLPNGFPQWTNDLKQEVVRLGNPALPSLGLAEHNALDDALELRHRHLWLEERYPRIVTHPIEPEGSMTQVIPRIGDQSTTLLPIYDPLRESL